MKQQVYSVPRLPLVGEGRGRGSGRGRGRGGRVKQQVV